MSNVPLMNLLMHPLASADQETNTPPVLALRGILLVLGLLLPWAAGRLLQEIHSSGMSPAIRAIASSFVVATTALALGVVIWRLYPILAATY